jgi:hypothetical protein
MKEEGQMTWWERAVVAFGVAASAAVLLFGQSAGAAL